MDLGILFVIEWFEYYNFMFISVLLIIPYFVEFCYALLDKSKSAEKIKVQLVNKSRRIMSCTFIIIESATSGYPFVLLMPHNIHVRKSPK